jgi:phage shock protein C
MTLPRFLLNYDIIMVQLFNGALNIMAEGSIEPKKIYLSRNNRVVAGVAGGIGEYFDVDPVLVRVAFFVFTFFGGFGVALYILLMIIIPEAPDNKNMGKKEAAQESVRDTGADTSEGQDGKRKKEWDQASVRDFIGAILILSGTLLLLNQLLPRFGIDWDVFWPLVLILLGGYIVFKRK